MAVLGYLPKLKRGLGLVFFHANAPFLTLYQLTNLQCHIFFPSQYIK